MFERLSFADIDKADFMNKIKEMRQDGYRLAVINASKKDSLTLLYCFEKDYNMLALRLTLQSNEEEVESTCELYPYSYIYENEIKELFGVKIINMRMDFKGHLYKKAIERPFTPKTDEQRQSDE